VESGLSGRLALTEETSEVKNGYFANILRFLIERFLIERFLIAGFKMFVLKILQTSGSTKSMISQINGFHFRHLK